MIPSVQREKQVAKSQGSNIQVKLEWVCRESTNKYINGYKNRKLVLMQVFQESDVKLELKVQGL